MVLFTKTSNFDLLTNKLEKRQAKQEKKDKVYSSYCNNNQFFVFCRYKTVPDIRTIPVQTNEIPEWNSEWT